MSGSNSNFQLAGTDFQQIKSNLVTFLKGQNVLTDANYTGSGLSVLLDILAYNTYYNANYLNLIASEIFLDSAIKRSSVVSKAKELGYVPKSATSSQAIVTIDITGLDGTIFNIPKYARFLTGQINNKNYTFITNQEYNVVVDGSGNGTIEDIVIYEGEPVSYNFTYNQSSNPNSLFNIPDTRIDLNSLVVYVQESISSANTDLYTRAVDYLNLDDTKKVYFIQESSDGTYDLYFGNGVLGKSLVDGNVILVNYISTSGSVANDISANNDTNGFRLISTPSNTYTSIVTTTTQASYSGSEKETIDSIKFQAPKSYSAQNRAVTKDDYINLIQSNDIGMTFDGVNVWGGEENDPPVYGTIFISLKPQGGYTFTDSQKKMLVENVIRPISVMTVDPKIVDPDYTYIQISADVLYDPKKTALSKNDLTEVVKSVVRSYVDSNLNTFNSFYSSSDVGIAIKNSNASILTSDINIKLQKKFYPSLTNSTSYNLFFNTELERGMFYSGIFSSPEFSTIDENTASVISGIYFEEMPTATSGIESINIVNPGYSYQFTPTITISGDGDGATAEAVMVNGSISKINVLTSGNNYTGAIVTITPKSNDTTGSSAVATVNLKGNSGKLRTYYFNGRNTKTILNENAGTVNYQKGLITLDYFSPLEITDPLGQFVITSTPKTQLLQSSYNTIITVDAFDPNAIIINLRSI